MRILCIYRHYWPDITPYARILKSIVEQFSADGHDVTVYTAQPSYNDVRQPRQPWRETLNGVDIIRVRLLPESKRFLPSRLVNFALWLSRATCHALWRRDYDLVFFNVHPPVMMGWFGRVIRRLTGIPYWVHYQDIHPESSLVAGRIHSLWLYRWLVGIDTRTAQRAALNIVLSGDMKITLRDRGVPDSKIAVMNNFSLPTAGGPPPEIPDVVADVPDGTFRVLFAGNLGEFQGLDNVIAAALELAGDPSIRFFFLGEGLARRRLMAAAGDARGQTVHFVPHQPVEVALETMKRCDLGIVCLMPGVYRVAFPSKTMMYLEAGCPVVAVVEQESQLARDVVANGFGYTCAQDDPQALAAVIRRAAAERSHWTAAERSAMAARAAASFGREQMLDRWSALAADTAAAQKSQQDRG